MTGWRKWLRRGLRALAVAYPLALLLAAILLRAYGESPWGRVALYLPRIVFALPLPFFVLVLALRRDWRYLLGTQVPALLLWLFPLMGFVLPWPHFADQGAPVLRVMSYNVNSGFWGWQPVLAQIDELHPDVVMMQEIFSDTRWPVDELKKRYPEAQASTQFIVASRWPIKQVVDPERVSLDGKQRSPRSISYLIDTPLGPIAFYNVHPVSPRQGLWSMRWGFGKALREGTLFDSERNKRMTTDSQLLDKQVALFAARALKESVPVIIGGDTNMTGLNPALAQLDGFVDGFKEAGWGFGYTYPSGHRSWMRLDRIYASPSLRFVGFQVGTHRGASDHLCVVADLQKRKP